MKKQRYLLKQRQEKKVKLMCAPLNEFPLCVAGAYFQTNVNASYIRAALVVSALCIRDVRELWQRERQKSNRLIKQNNNFARATRFFVHFSTASPRLQRENA